MTRYGVIEIAAACEVLENVYNCFPTKESLVPDRRESSGDGRSPCFIAADERLAGGQGALHRGGELSPGLLNISRSGRSGKQSRGCLPGTFPLLLPSFVASSVMLGFI